MHQQQVDIVDAEVLEALVDRAGKIGGAQIFVRHLGAEEDLAARHAGCADAFTDLGLAAVFPRGVDVAIAELERGCDVLAADIGAAEIRGAEPDRRDPGVAGREHGD